MAEVNERSWKVPGRRAKRKAWGFTVQVDGKQKRVYKSEWTKDDAQRELAALLLKVEAPKPAERYLATKARKRTLRKDERILKHLESAFGADTALEDLTANRISEYKAKRLATKLGKPEAQRMLTAAGVNRPLALLPPPADGARGVGSVVVGTEDPAREGAAGPAPVADGG